MPKLKLDAALRKEYNAVADILYTKSLVVDANPFVVKTTGANMFEVTWYGKNSTSNIPVSYTHLNLTHGFVVPATFFCNQSRNGEVPEEIISRKQQHHVTQCTGCAAVAVREGMHIDEVEVSNTCLEQGVKLSLIHI